MLLRFGVSNHLSLKTREEFSLVASSLKDDDAGLINCAAAPNGRVLPIAVIYGANASGKSNFVETINFMRDAVRLSHRQGEPGKSIPRAPFALDSAYAKKPSLYDVDFVVDKVRFHYGFEVTDKAFNKEWLYAFPKGKRQLLFNRKHQKFNFGRGLKGRNRVIADLTRANSLFLSAAVQNDHKILTKIAGFFMSLQGSGELSMPGALAAVMLARKKLDDRIVELLEKMNTGVVGYRVEDRKLPEKAKDMIHKLDSAIKLALKSVSGINVSSSESDKIIQLAHRGAGGKSVFFDLNDESVGTIRLLPLLRLMFKALDEGTLLVVDELNASLHTQACEALLMLFSSPKTNPKGAQLIATTHDTNLLRSPLLRRDQIWFTEKDAEGATHLYPLTDIRTKKGDNIEKGYLQGRYGAVPFAGPIPELITTG